MFSGHVGSREHKGITFCLVEERHTSPESPEKLLQNGPKDMEGLLVVLLLHLCVTLPGVDGVPQLRRQKRDWVIPTRKLKENLDYRNISHVARIRSDSDKIHKLYYGLMGPGASEDPINLFMVDENSGLVRVRGILDREQRETYILTGVARFRNGTIAEAKIDLRFDVEDENDNSPVFATVSPAYIVEGSPGGTLVGVITATDLDKANTSYSKISYSIMKQEPADGQNHFRIDRHTGSIYVKDDTLDRERQSSYTLTIRGVDMDGAPKGNTGTGTIVVRVTDINDNPPKLEKDEYSASIMENTADVEVLRVKVQDTDQAGTENWLAVFDIISGNDDEIFGISTDPKTNEGVLVLKKPVDFEQNPDIKLGVIVNNVAPIAGEGDGDGDGEGDGGGGGGGGGAGPGAGPTGGGGTGPSVGLGAPGVPGAPGPSVKAPAKGPGIATGASAGAGGIPNKKRPKKKKKPTGKVYAVNIGVINEPEGATFKPAVKPVSVSENPKDSPKNGVIAVYGAIDADTGEPAENVQYVKGYDPDNWLQIDPKTAEIRLQKAPDRESPYVVNGTYIAKILSLTNDMPAKTATGTIALQVGDVNDNCPELTTTVEYICEGTAAINVTGHDDDGDPNGAPLSFSVVAEKSRWEWKVEPLDGTRATLRPVHPLWPGFYEVFLIISDQQGFACPDPQSLEIHVCSCKNNGTCGAEVVLAKAASLKDSHSNFGGTGVAAVILGLVVMLVAGLLLASCRCGSVIGDFSDIPYDAQNHLMVYHTEGQGEDKEVPLLSSPVLMSRAVMSPVRANINTYETSMGATYDMYHSSVRGNHGFKESNYDLRASHRELYSAREEQELQYERFDGLALPALFLHEYYSQRASYTAEEEAATDGVLEYAYEGQGSPAGSVGCCSNLQSQDDLQFLDDLEPKFRTLADICSPTRPSAPPTTKRIVISEVNKVKQIPGPPVEMKQTTVQHQNPVHHQSVSITKTSTTATVNDGAGTNRRSPTTMSKPSATVVDGPAANRTSTTVCNGTATSRTQEKFAHTSSSLVQSSPVSPIPTAMMPSLGQPLLLQQQPSYYITTPMMQPMHYMVQPQLQNTMLLAEAPASNLPGMVLVNGGFGHTDHILQIPNTSGNLGRTRSGSLQNINQPLEVWPQSDNQRVVIGVREPIPDNYHHTDHILHMDNPARALGRTRFGSLQNDSGPLEVWPSSDSQRVVIGVRERIMSDSGVSTGEYQANAIMLPNGQNIAVIDMATTAPEGGLVSTEKGKKKKSVRRIKSEGGVSTELTQANTTTLTNGKNIHVITNGGPDVFTGKVGSKKTKLKTANQYKLNF
ncbi:desmoglein-2-like [Sphaeramia orbicularis]|uniref:desmoglein-2-like n=1 Tax=Sphaeramia orbicularis TaxID=375764 RepID=UPI00117E04DA|nr:desmoglein-2-like [Sphaeramia orbicularis]